MYKLEPVEEVGWGGRRGSKEKEVETRQECFLITHLTTVLSYPRLAEPESQSKQLSLVLAMH